MWCIPPTEDARFVAAMEDVLEVYERPYNQQHPVVCLDEAAKQILGEVRESLTMRPASASGGQVERYDNEYERRGTCALFMLFEPLGSWREVMVKARRTALDYADVVRYLCDEKYPDAQKIVLVQDNLNRTEYGACIKHLSQKKHSGWHSESSGTTRQSMEAGSTWPKSN